MKKRIAFCDYLLQNINKHVSLFSSGFPGAQPVSMDKQNIKFLEQKPYKVSWKADGTR